MRAATAATLNAAPAKGEGEGEGEEIKGGGYFRPAEQGDLYHWGRIFRRPEAAPGLQRGRPHHPRQAVHPTLHIDWSEYLGEWKRGKRNGIGTHISANLDTYEGKFVGNLRVGRGTLRTKAGDVTEGLWDKDVPHGLAKKTLASGITVKGLFEYGVFRG